METMTNTDEVRIARNAADVLNNEAYKAAMEHLKAQIVEQWKDCPVRDIEGQRLLLQLAKLTDKFDSILSGYIARGDFAQHRINLDNERNESMGARVMRRTFNR